MTTEGKVLAILLMQFSLPPVPAMKAVDAWLKEHPQENWDRLKELLHQKKITLVNGKLATITQQSVPNSGKGVTPSQGKQAVHYSQSRQPQPPSVKTFRFRGVTYHKVEMPPIQHFTMIDPTIPPDVSQPNPNDDIPASDPQIVNFHEYAERKKRSQENQLNQTERSQQQG
ncbi:MAG: hypothetical protein RID53_28355 [Coleofasciculus sp. B1-GNL1-01]|uniref:hypothetical protein n=1 Tax=Coleofasciculus sp. B1-GNL1-01 TaxID=3068484 RepID=UPI0032FC5A83